MKSISKAMLLALLGLGMSGGCAGSDDESPVGSCFSPEQTPALALEHAEAGCACNGEQGQCVRVRYDGQDVDLALVCAGGRWRSVEDGPCWSGSSP